MGLNNSVICRKYFLESQFGNLSQYKLDMANKTCENLLTVNCTVVVCKVTKKLLSIYSITTGMIHLTAQRIFGTDRG